MSTLILELRPGEMMILNGAPIRFRSKARLELTAQARFLFGRQIMSPAQADSPARRIYFAIQSAYVGEDAERANGLSSTRLLVEDFKASTTSSLAKDILDRAITAVVEGNFYQALKFARRIIRHEDAILERYHDIFD